MSRRINMKKGSVNLKQIIICLKQGRATSRLIISFFQADLTMDNHLKNGIENG